MKPLLKKNKAISFSFIGMVLFQSCIVYSSSSITKASESNNRRIKIQTYNGDMYKLWWIENKDDSIYSILKTDRSRIPANDIKEIKTIDGIIISLDSAIQYSGIVEVYTTKPANQLYGEFFRLNKVGDEIIAFEKIGKDTATVIIPIQDIYKVKLENKPLSGIVDLGIIIGSIITFGVVYVLINGFEFNPSK